MILEKGKGKGKRTSPETLDGKGPVAELEGLP